MALPECGPLGKNSVCDQGSGPTVSLSDGEARAGSRHRRVRVSPTALPLSPLRLGVGHGQKPRLGVQGSHRGEAVRLSARALGFLPGLARPLSVPKALQAPSHLNTHHSPVRMSPLYRGGDPARRGERDWAVEARDTETLCLLPTPGRYRKPWGWCHLGTISAPSDLPGVAQGSWGGHRGTLAHQASLPPPPHLPFPPSQPGDIT